VESSRLSVNPRDKGKHSQVPSHTQPTDDHWAIGWNSHSDRQKQLHPPHPGSALPRWQVGNYIETGIAVANYFVPTGPSSNRNTAMTAELSGDQDVRKLLAKSGICVVWKQGWFVFVRFSSNSSLAQVHSLQKSITKFGAQYNYLNSSRTSPGA